MLSCKTRQAETQDIRIISLVPSLTLTCYFLGLDKEIIAITEYCKYPEAWRKEKSKISGGLSPNLEVIASMKPSHVLLSNYQVSLKSKLENLGIKTVIIKQMRIEDVFDAIKTLSKITGRTKRGEFLSDSLDIFIKKNSVINTHRLKVLIVVSREIDSLNNVFVTEYKGFLEELIFLAGGESIFGDKPHSSGPLSKEILINMNPDVIIELHPDEDISTRKIEVVKNVWKDIPDINAVKKGNIFILTDSYYGLPSPRIGEILVDFKNILKECKE